MAEEIDNSELERRFAAVLLADPNELVAVYRRDMRFAYVNPANARALGFSPEVLAGRHWREFGLDPSVFEEVERQLLAAFADNQPRRYDVYFRNPQGLGAHYEYSLTPIIEADGPPQFAIAVARDITVRQRSNAYRQRVIGIVGHDLRNPIGTIRMSAQLLAREPGLTPRAERHAERILRNAERMQRMVSDFLDYSVAEDGQMIPLLRKPIDLVEIAKVVVEEVRLNHPGRDIQLGGDSRLEGLWDPDRISQLLINLSGNALQHGSPDGVARMTLSGRADAAIIEVHNHGDPIPAESLPFIFEPFRKASSDHEHGSVGLGLYIVEQIARAHGGSVAVTSSPESGTLFRVQLPLREATGGAAQV